MNLLIGVLSSAWGTFKEKIALDNEIWGSRILLLNAEAVSLGNEYGDIRSRDGYEFYEVNLEYINNGQASALGYQTAGELSGDQPGDVIDMDIQESYPEGASEVFARRSQGVIPAGRKGAVKRIIQVKNYVKQLTFHYYPGGELGEEQKTIAVP